MDNKETSLPSEPKALSLISVDQLLKKSWHIYKKRIKTLVGISVVPMVVGLAFGFIATSSGLFLAVVSFISKNILYLLFFLPIVIILTIASIVFGFWAELALIYAIWSWEQKIGIIESFRAVRNKITSSLWISMLVGIAVMIGFFLLVIPGIIFIVWFFAATYILVVESITGTKALSQSKKLVSGKWLAVFWRFGVIIVLAIGISYVVEAFSRATGIPFLGNIIGLLITPFPVIYSFLIYESLRKLKSEPPLKPQENI